MTKREFLDTVFALAPNEANAIMDAFDEYVESNVVPTGRSGKERGMSKYIIEIPDDVQYVLFNGKADNKCYTAVRPVAELEELNSDYINEHFGELQDEAYQRGFEDGKKSIDLGCEDCKYHEDTSLTNPCSECTRAWKDHYTPAPHTDRIEVGDEVIYNGVTKCVVVTPETDVRYASLFDCNGIHYSADHRECKKTGKHYDIASILEAMRK